MKKRIVSAVLAVCMLFGSAALLPESFSDSPSVMSVSAEESGNLKYSVLTDGTVAITGLVSRTETVDIPSQIDGKKVTVIKDSAFAALQPNKVTTKVTLPDTLTTIEQYAFMNMQALTSITIPSSVKTIGLGAFYYCKALQTVTFKGSLSSLGSGVFSGCSALTKIDIPNGVPTIDGNLFANCTSLKTVTLPASATTIVPEAFNGCTALQSITVASGNPNYSTEDGVLYNKNKTSIICCPKAKTSLTIPGSIREISQEFMFNSSSLTTLVLKEGITTIGPQAFAFCKKLTSVSLPSTLTKIGDYAFNTCTSLSEITVPASVTSIGKKALGFYRTSVDGSDIKQNGFTIKGYENSQAQSWAKTNGVNFVVIGQACSHTYGTPTWAWTGYTAAKATAKCSKCQQSLIVDATISSSTTAATCTTASKTTYTAKAVINGTTYTSKQEKTGSTDSNAHKWNSTASWSWASDYSSATATLTCTYNSNHKHTISKNDVTITSSTTAASCGKDGKTVYTAKATYGGKTFSDSKTVTIKAPGHTYGSPDWTWTKTSTGYTCKAKFTCSKCKAFTTVNATVQVVTHDDASCTAEGKTVYTANAFFNGTTYSDTKTDTIAALGHNWGKPSYSWTKTSTGYTCTATRICSRNSSHKETETVTASYKVTKAPTTTAVGQGTYTASFSNTGFETKTKTVEIPKETVKWNKPTYSWTKSGNDYVCTATRTASDSSGKKETETVTAKYQITKAPTCTKSGEAEYIAAFKNAAFESQSKIVYPAAKGHSYGSWKTTAFDVDKGTSSQVCCCTVCNFKKTRTVSNSVQRLSGSNRYATAAAISQGEFAKGAATTVVLANGTKFADALAGATLAKAYNAQILLTDANSLPADTLNEIKRLGAKNVIVLGGSGSVSAAVQQALISNGLTVTVVKGSSRFATAVEIAKQTQKQTGKTPTEIFFVSSEKFADALSVSAVAATNGSPIIYLPKTGSIDSVTASYLASMKGKIKKAYVIGGSGVISADVMTVAAKALGLKADSTVIRVKGQTKYETCIAVNQKFAGVLTGKAICVATGENFPDALAGGVFAAINKAPLFLAHGSLSSEQKSYLKSKAPDTIYIFGGKGAVPVDLVKSVAAASV